MYFYTLPDEKLADTWRCNLHKAGNICLNLDIPGATMGAAILEFIDMVSDSFKFNADPEINQ